MPTIIELKNQVENLKNEMSTNNIATDDQLNEWRRALAQIDDNTKPHETAITAETDRLATRSSSVDFGDSNQFNRHMELLDANQKNSKAVIEITNSYRELMDRLVEKQEESKEAKEAAVLQETKATNETNETNETNRPRQRQRR